MTPKEQVLKEYKEVTVLRGSNTWIMANGVYIGTGKTPKQAWADACNKLKKKGNEYKAQQ